MTTMVAAASPPSSAGMSISSASGWLALLQEHDLVLKQHALRQLLNCVDTLWHEVAEAVADLEALAEDATLDVPTRQLAAAVASRVFFHLEEAPQALRLALYAGAGYWSSSSSTAASSSSTTSKAYTERLVAAALDAYIAARQREGKDAAATAGTAATSTALDEVDAAVLSVADLQPMIHDLLQQACAAGEYAHAMGICLEAQEAAQMNVIFHAVEAPVGTENDAHGPKMKLLKYAVAAANDMIASKAFRQEALTVCAEHLQMHFDATGKGAFDLILVSQLLKNSKAVATVIQKLLEGTEDDALLGLQVCFDLMDTGDQAFVNDVAGHLKASTASATADADADADTSVPPVVSPEVTDRVAQAERVLVGGFSAELALSFLHKQSRADRLIMENLRKSLEERSSGSRSSVLHNAAVLTHAYLYAGTTNDSFLRDYLDWMKKASNWAKFSATASLGVIHASHITEAMQLLQPYLPADPTAEGASPVSDTGGYPEGGSLYALGLMHGSNVGSCATKRQETTEFLRNHLRSSHVNEVISHGAALGVGLTAMGTADYAIVNELKELLVNDSAVSGEAAGIAIGMVLVGTGASNSTNALVPSQNREEIMEAVVELKNYVRLTSHEKIIRGVSMGLALMNFGQEENADALIEELRSDRDPVMRYGAMYTLALAYCGTGSNKAVRTLLHTAVSDVSDDVRMAAVIGLAFVLFKTPGRVPELVKLLLESFNPHVRYASCMAVGIAMAGSGNAESIAMLEPMLEDMTDYVRQGALIGTAMIYMQQSDTANSRKIRSFRDKIATIVTEKHHSTLTKMGAIMAIGIIDAGGRNCMLALGSRNGFTKMSSAVGLALWLQHWHWYPMMHMFSLALTPTYTIGLNKDFKFPKNFEIHCSSKPSVFAYPKKLEEKKKEEKKRVETVTLSTTAKEKARIARKKAKSGESMDVDEVATAAAPDDAAAATSMDVDKEGGAAAEEDDAAKPKKKREPEKTSFRVSNPSRVTLAQSKVCAFDLDQRYRPIRPEEKPIGVIMLTDSTPEEEEDLGAVKAPSLEPEGELAPPEAFEWTPPPAPAAAMDDGATKMDEDTPPAVDAEASGSKAE